jgi:nitrogen fixation NifU-like protein
MYSEQILDHFHNPRHVGELENATAVIEAANPVCGDTLKLWAIIHDGTVLEARFKVQGCVPAVAYASWLTEWIIGRPLAELASLTPDHVEAALGGLPPGSKHAAVLASDVLKRLLENTK